MGTESTNENLQESQLPEININLNILLKATNFIECDECVYILEVVEPFIKNNRTKEKIEFVLEHICRAMPGTFRTECDFLVRVYGPQIIEYLKAHYSPRIICEKIHVCPHKPDNAYQKRSRAPI